MDGARGRVAGREWRRNSTWQSNHSLHSLPASPDHTRRSNSSGPAHLGQEYRQLSSPAKKSQLVTAHGHTITIQSPEFTLGFILAVVCSMGLDVCMMTYIHH